VWGRLQKVKAQRGNRAGLEIERHSESGIRIQRILRSWTRGQKKKDAAEGVASKNGDGTIKEDKVEGKKEAG